MNKPVGAPPIDLIQSSRNRIAALEAERDEWRRAHDAMCALNAKTTAERDEARAKLAEVTKSGRRIIAMLAEKGESDE